MFQTLIDESMEKADSNREDKAVNLADLEEMSQVSITHQGVIEDLINTKVAKIYDDFDHKFKEHSK